MKSRTTVKTRLIAKNYGLNGLILNAKTQNDVYRPFALHEIMKLCRKNISILFTANSDIFSEEAAAFALDYTQTDERIIGRDSCSEPWIIMELNKLLFGRQHEGEIDDGCKKRTAKKFVEAIYKRHTANHRFYKTGRQNHFVYKVINWYLLTLPMQATARQST